MQQSRLVWYGRRRRVFLGKNCSSCARATGQGDHFQFFPLMSMESQHSTGGPACHDFPRFVIISEKSRPEVGNRWLWSSQNGAFWEKRPYGQIFTNVFQSPTCGHGNTSFCANFVKFGRWNRALFNGQKKNKISARPPVAASARIAPKICQGQLQTIDSEFPKFDPNPFTSGGVIDECVNIVQTRHKVFAILGEASASASSPSKNHMRSVICVNLATDRFKRANACGLCFKFDA